MARDEGLQAVEGLQQARPGALCPGLACCSALAPAKYYRNIFRKVKRTSATFMKLTAHLRYIQQTFLLLIQLIIWTALPLQSSTCGTLTMNYPIYRTAYPIYVLTAFWCLVCLTLSNSFCALKIQRTCHDPGASRTPPSCFSPRRHPMLFPLYTGPLCLLF